MSTDLIPVRRGRPPIITVDGCVVYLSVKDAEYLRVKRSLTATMLAAHPDRHPIRPQTGLFRVARARLTAYLRAQRRVYWALGQMPPDWRGPATPPPGMPARKGYRLRLSGRFQTAREKGASCSRVGEVFPVGVHKARRVKPPEESSA